MKHNLHVFIAGIRKFFGNSTFRMIVEAFDEVGVGYKCFRLTSDQMWRVFAEIGRLCREVTPGTAVKLSDVRHTRARP
jgi:hypothetical protein